MITSIYRSIFIFAFIISALSSVSFGQITTTTASSENVTPAVQQARDAVRKVLDDSGRSFKDGLTALKENRRSDTGTAFDKSVEVFLYSTLNIQRDPKLQTCYSQLIETVYRLEFPSTTQAPQIRSLSATCNWNWTDADMKLADEVAALAVKTAKTPSTAVASASAGAGSAKAPSEVGGRI